MRIVSVVGTRPQLIKAAALQPALRAHHTDVFVDTGQHWDEAMAGAFFEELGLARPDHSLGIGGGGHAEQTGRMLIALEPVLAAERPDAVLVFGDTNSTLAGGLAAAKLGIPVAHVEAGLRSFDRRMPEELNRIVVDHLASWCFAPTPTAVDNLAAEGVTGGVTLVGDLMEDLAARTVGEGPVGDVPAVGIRDGDRALAAIGDRLGLGSQALAPGPPALSSGPPALSSGPPALSPGGYILATVHRAENRAPAAMAAWLAILADAATVRPVVLALHPGTRQALEACGLALPAGVHAIPPQGYRTTLTLELHAAAVVTDSGGVQREAAWLDVPCLVLRGTTEWLEAVESSEGRMVVVGLDRERASAELSRLAPIDIAPAMARRRAAAVSLRPAGAAEAIVAALGSGARG